MKKVLASERRGNRKIWAWVLSLTAHLVLFGVFASLKFSRSSAIASILPIPRVSISQLRMLNESSPVIPKPGIRRYGPTEAGAGKHGPLPKLSRSVVGDPYNQSQDNNIDGAAVYSSWDMFATSGTDFFGSFTDLRKICYVVDCSGSMQGLFGRVRSQLKSSISTLEPDQYFNIIFFSDGRLVELSKGSLVRATEKAKLSAYDLVYRVRPSGQTNALEALVRAMSIRDNTGNSPQLIYFLTDGFDLKQISDKRFSFMIESQRKRLASRTRINTIGFWTQQQDRKILQRIATLSGGEFIEID